MASVRSEFDFEDGGRLYACHLEDRRVERLESWWWFGVSGDVNLYAPFRAAVGDTETSVRVRVVAYYGHCLARRPWSWRRWESALWRKRWERELART